MAMAQLAADKKALAPVQSFVGSWRGVGMVDRLRDRLGRRSGGSAEPAGAELPRHLELRGVRQVVHRGGEDDFSMFGGADEDNSRPARRPLGPGIAHDHSPQPGDYQLAERI